MSKLNSLYAYESKIFIHVPVYRYVNHFSSKPLYKRTVNQYVNAEYSSQVI